VDLKLINGGRFGNWDANEALVKQENALLEQLHADAELQAKLYPVTEDMLAVGLVLIYPLGENAWGCHCIRDRASGYQYLPDTDIRGAVRAGKMLTLP
jgi:hypothetical protein